LSTAFLGLPSALPLVLKKVEPMVVVAYSVFSFILEKKEQMVAQLLCWCCIFCRSSVPLLVSPPLCFSLILLTPSASLFFTLSSYFFFVSAVLFPVSCVRFSSAPLWFSRSKSPASSASFLLFFFLVYLHPLPCMAFSSFFPLRSVPLSTVFFPPFTPQFFFLFPWSQSRFSFSGFYNQRMPCSRMDFNAIKESVFLLFSGEEDEQC